MNTAAARQVTLAMLIAGLVYGAAYGLEYAVDQRTDRQSIANPLPKLGGWETLIAWGTVYLMLVIMADIPASGQLAVAFAWMFVLAILFSYGIEAFSNLLELQNGGTEGGDPPATTIEPPSPSGLGPT